MKQKKNNNLEWIFVLVITIGGLFLLERFTKKSESNLMENGKFSIGTFEEFGFGFKAGGRNYKYYYLDENGKVANKVDQERMPKNELRKILKRGDQFLVIYNNHGSGIYFDRPIKDSTDFKRYVQEFEAMRK